MNLAVHDGKLTIMLALLCWHNWHNPIHRPRCLCSIYPSITKYCRLTCYLELVRTHHVVTIEH